MITLILAAAIVGTSDDPAEIGRSILAVDRLLEYRLPDRPTEADHARAKELRTAAVEAGRLTKLYPWVLGRLKLEIDLVESELRDAKPEPDREKKRRERIAFLRKLILEIDAPY